MSEPTERELVGYSDPWTVEPGQSLRVMVSTSEEEVSLQVVRLRHGDSRPGAPGLKSEPVDLLPAQTGPGRRQQTRSGSFVAVPYHPVLSGLSGLTIRLWLWPTAPKGNKEQGLVSHWSDETRQGWILSLRPDGRLGWRLSNGQRVIELISSRPLRPRTWNGCVASYDLKTGRLLLHHTGPGIVDLTQEAVSELGLLVVPSTPLLIAAAAPDPQPHGSPQTAVRGHFNGKIENPILLGYPIAPEQAADLLHGDFVPRGSTVAQWDFATSPQSDRIIDRGPHGLHGQAVNQPARAVTAHKWNGQIHHFLLAPSQYAAIHFHDDDLDNARWEPDFAIRLPDDLPSGVYAARLRAGDLEDHVPFFVRPPIGQPTAHIALLLPTLTYLAYANERLQFDDFDGGIKRQAPPSRLDKWLRAHPEMGLSLYDHHADGSGCCHSSRLRPIPNLRPDYINWATGAPRHLGADLYIVDWLENLGAAYDVITDDDLDAHGVDQLAAYRVVITGTHPEYVTERMLDALTAYRDGGGRIMYLGGNGFYWVASIHPERHHLMEVRRGFAGTRAWTSEPGEQHHAATGELGGLWRHRGRPPNQLVGVGFSAQGWSGNAAPYTRQPGSLQTRHAWIFEGIDEDEPIGDQGLVMNGAAGDEVDRHDEAMGPPEDTTVLATARIASSAYHVAVEDMPMLLGPAHGEADSRVRADMTVLHVPHDGAVFSASSIGWAGALSLCNYQGVVGRITRNVLANFLAR